MNLKIKYFNKTVYFFKNKYKITINKENFYIVGNMDINKHFHISTILNNSLWIIGFSDQNKKNIIGLYFKQHENLVKIYNNVYNTIDPMVFYKNIIK
jgi:Tfp pilus assembly protein PilZ